MPIPEVGSPEWWLKKLKRDLDSRRLNLKKFDDYYSGDHNLKFASRKFRQAFGGLFAEFSDNWCELVVNAVEERLKPKGFRVGEDPKGDKRAWEIWQANDLDAGANLAHLEALIFGTSYLSVWGDDDGQPLISVEHPQEMIVHYRPGTHIREAALKSWEADDGTRMATLYLPDGLYKFQAKKGIGTPTWLDRIPNGEDWPLKNPLGVVPVVPLVNRPRLLKPGQSEIATVIPIQDAVNKLCSDMLVAAEYGAFRQRYAIGWEVEKDPETGKPVSDLVASQSHLWASKSPDTKFGDFEVTDLENYVKPIEMFVQHAASQTRTPPHYFYLSGNFPSGESIKSAETGLVAKARSKMVPFGDSWETAMRLAFAISGDRRRAQITKSEMIWGDPESRTESELADSLMKQRALGVPLQTIWTKLGYSPQEQADMLILLQQEADMGILPPNPVLAPGSPLRQQEPQPAA